MAFQLAMTLGFMAIGTFAIGLILLLGKVIRPHNPTELKTSTYECGENPIGIAWFNFNNRFYLISLVFVVFDVEIALILPTLLVYKEAISLGQGLLVFTEIFLFLLILSLGLVYVWAKGDLDWIKQIAQVGTSSVHPQKGDLHS